MNRAGPGTGALLLVLANSTLGQTLLFERTIDAPSPFISAEWGYAVQPTADGGFVVAGFTAETLFPLIDDMLLVKTNANGDTLWTRAFGGPGDDGARDVVELEDGGFAVLGTTQSFGAGGADLYLVRTDAQGDEIWSRTYGTPRLDLGDALCAMPGGGLLLVGSAADSTGDFDMLAVRTDANGDALWTRHYGGPGEQGAAGVCLGPAGGAVITGWTAGGGLFDGSLLAVDANGDSIWAQTFGGANEDWGSDVSPTSDGGYFVVGTTGAFFGAGFSGQALALRTDSAGNEIWSRAFGVAGATDAQGNGGQQTAEGGYALGGSRIAPGGDLDVFVVRLNESGHEIWSRRYDRGGTTDHGADLRQTADGHFIVTGYTHDLDTWYDVYLAKVQDDEPTGTPHEPGRGLRARVVPNPFVHAATFEIDPLPGVRRWELELYDAAGRRVGRRDVRGAWRVQVEGRDLAAGTYLYRIRTERGDEHAGKVTLRR